MGSFTRQLRVTGCDILINKSINDETLEIVASNAATAKRVNARIKKRKLDPDKFTVKFIQNNENFVITSNGNVKKIGF
jgi:hypothetical protein